MALSWIFSGKRKEEKTVPVTVEAVEVGNDEDYTIIQANPQTHGMYPQIPPSPYPPASYTPLPYSVLPQRENQQSSYTSARTSVQNQIDGIPFVLNPSLEQSSKQNYLAGIEDMRRAVFQIAADINDSTFHYDFKAERNTIREASMFNHKN